MAKFTSVPLIKRFLAKIEVDEISKCWNWTGCKIGANPRSSGGYGQIRVDSKMQSAHRVSYELHKGHIPDGMNVCHGCDNRACVNPDHLFLGSHVANMADMRAKGRQSRGERRSGKLTEGDVVAIRASGEKKLIELADRYGVTVQMIHLIRTRKKWAHVPDAPQGHLTGISRDCAP